MFSLLQWSCMRYVARRRSAIWVFIPLPSYIDVGVYWYGSFRWKTVRCSHVGGNEWRPSATTHTSRLHGRIVVTDATLLGPRTSLAPWDFRGTGDSFQRVSLFLFLGYPLFTFWLLSPTQRHPSRGATVHPNSYRGRL